MGFIITALANRPATAMHLKPEAADLKDVPVTVQLPSQEQGPPATRQRGHQGQASVPARRA